MCLPFSRIHATPRWRAKLSNALALVFLFPFPTVCVPLSRVDRARDFKRAERRARTYLADRARPGDGTAAARSPSEVKVRRVGTGCARIHFFGLALDFFLLFPAGEARGISSHVCTDLAYTVDSRDTLARRMHMALARVHRTFLAASLSLSPSHSRPLVTSYEHTRASPISAHTYVRACLVQMVL